MFEMSLKTATYHGYTKQGHPSGPTNTGWKSLDKRYLTKENYKSIVKIAKDFLKKDWFKTGWGDGAADAPLRAALDLAIHTGDENSYQSKIDVETYNMLLAELSGFKEDLFSETMFVDDSQYSGNPKKPKKAFDMSKSESVRNLLKIASDIRGSDPKQALEIVKNVRSLIAIDPEEGKPEGGKPEGLPPEDTDDRAATGMPPMEGVDSEDGKPGAKNPESHQAQPEKEIDPKELGKLHKQLMDSLNKEDVDAFVNAFNEMDQAISKVSSRIRSAADAIEFKSLAHLKPDEIKGLFADVKKQTDTMKHELDEMDIDMFLSGFVELKDLLKKKTAAAISGIDVSISNIQKAVQALRAASDWSTAGHLDSIEAAVAHITSSSLVGSDILIRIASKHPEMRSVLLPILVAARKRKPKKKNKKKDKKKAPKKPMLAPPFMKGKGRKSSIIIVETDANWG